MNFTQGSPEQQFLNFTLKEFEIFLQDIDKVKDLGFNLRSLKKLLLQEKTRGDRVRQTITLDLDKKFVYITTYEREKSDKSEKIRASGHYFDNKLKCAKPNSQQVTIFDVLSPKTKEKIEKVDYEVSVVGIHLTPPQNRLVTALTKLLYDKSEHNDPFSVGFYSGNYTSIPIHNYGGSGEPIEAPVIKIKPTELYKSYLDADQYSGADIKYIRGLVKELDQKKFLIRYDRKKHINKDGKLEKLTDRVEDFQSLIKVINFIPDLTEEEIENLNAGQREIAEKRGVYIIALNPILIDQIATKYVEFPKDIEKRTVIAAGGHHRVTEAIIAFRDYMLRELSAKRIKCEIDEENLLYTLKLQNFLKRREPTRARKKMADAIQVSQKLGLISSFNLIKGKKGQAKFEFELNPFFE